MKKLITAFTIAAALTGCAAQQHEAPKQASEMDRINATMKDYAKCQRLGYLAATDGDKDEIGALKFDIKTRVRNNTIHIDRAGCEEAINRGKSEGFEAREAAERKLADAAKKAW